MKVTLWGTRGSVPTPGPETARYGGNTACVCVTVHDATCAGSADGTLLVLDAGTGIRRLGRNLAAPLRRVDLLLTHLHLDHIQGLGFFGPLQDPECEVHIWGPASTTYPLGERLTRYLSPPLFPTRLRELPLLHLHEVAPGDFEVGPCRVTAAFICHPNPTLGFRITAGGATLAYLPDHEPALGANGSLLSADWTSGYSLAAGADLLIHDAQFTDEEYADRAGWGHSSMRQAFAFADLAGVKQLVPFHHDPAHTDDDLDRLLGAMIDAARPPFAVGTGAEGATFQVGPRMQNP